MTRAPDAALTPKPAPPVIRPGLPRVRTTFQLAADLAPRNTESPDAVAEGARDGVLAWLESKFPERLPDAAREGHSFETEVHGQSVHTISIPERGVWSIRLVQPDAPFKDRPAVPGRTWTTEVSLCAEGSGARFGVRVTCASLAYADEPIALTRPRVVVDLANRFDMREAGPIIGQAWEPRDDDDLRRLHDLVCDVRRGLPV